MCFCVVQTRYKIIITILVFQYGVSRKQKTSVLITTETLNGGQWHILRNPSHYNIALFTWNWFLLF